ncbi:putative glyoxalase superfamily protein PhnB [Caulobacter ginsengisoli]|uniref:Glyoxalase superfamily protein PhnB n=1 Tax=Caulobacter ginsengisoli TaxID=400775 RepID=A0ABU0ITI8_9CAUL|nr:VOC family protein [Caulobacter ginsengisoli]MDQ0464354.1 putative glyoxalase superfamily protein PhnB [Caulobacter ginsengisoli]
MPTVMPMLHVPDVAVTAAWYEAIGFKVRATNQREGCELDWAALTLGDSEIMLSIGGQASDAFRREVDLYIRVDDIQAMRDRLPIGVEIFEDLHDTEYGMREFIVRDCNRFWITFGQPIG